jgi:uncharacterized BrkB/YihY/UPF0761 family membrane protein
MTTQRTLKYLTKKEIVVIMIWMFLSGLRPTVQTQIDYAYYLDPKRENFSYDILQFLATVKVIGAIAGLVTFKKYFSQMDFKKGALIFTFLFELKEIVQLPIIWG